METNHIDVQNQIVTYIIWDFIQPLKNKVTEFQSKQMKLETISLEKQYRHGQKILHALPYV